MERSDASMPDLPGVVGALPAARAGAVALAMPPIRDFVATVVLTDKRRESATESRERTARRSARSPQRDACTLPAWLAGWSRA